MATGRRLPYSASLIRKIKDKDVPQDHKNRMIARALEQLTRVQAVGLPPAHAGSHKGGQDSLVARVKPTTITAGDVPTIGDPSQGFATARHRHGLDATLSALADATVNPDGSISIDNPSLQRLLAKVLLEMMVIRKELRRLKRG